MLKEQWKQVKGYEKQYLVSNFGKVKSLQRLVNHPKKGKQIVRERTLKQSKSRKGYMRVCLSKEGNHKMFSVHRLVADAFINNKYNKPCINHIDGNKNNNIVDNLEWCTNEENQSHAWNNGMKVRIYKNATSKYPGVSWSKIGKKWIAQISINNKRNFLGYYDQEEEAAKAYQNKLIQLNLN